MWPDNPDKLSFALPVVVLLAAIALRGMVIVSGSSSLQEDPDSYARLAVNWAKLGAFGFEQTDGSVRKTAFRPPLYPWLLSWIVWRDNEQETVLPWSRVAALQLLLSAASIVLVFSIARTLGVSYPWIPAAAWACDPLLLRASQLVMTETLFACLVLLAWQLWLLLFENRRANAASTESSVMRSLLLPSSLLGLVFGLAILTRPTAAPRALLCWGATIALLGKRRRGRVLSGTVVMLGILCCVLPWTMRNLRALGEPVWATTHGGYTLLLANNPQIYDHFRKHGPSRGWDAEPFHQAWAARLIEPSSPALKDELSSEDYWFIQRRQPQASGSGDAVAQQSMATDGTAVRDSQLASPAGVIDEVDDNQLAYASAKACIRRHPMLFLNSIVYRVGWFWALWPYTGEFSWTALAIGCWYGTWYLLALKAACLRSVRSNFLGWLPALLLVVSLTAIHGVYWSNMRMRGPLMGTVYIMATLQFGSRKSE